MRKQISAESEAKIELFLTEEGLICFEEHRKVHEEANQKWCKLFDELDDKSYELMFENI